MKVILKTTIEYDVSDDFLEVEMENEYCKYADELKTLYKIQFRKDPSDFLSSICLIS